MTHLDLFSGIGGFALASQREGFRTIAFCECDDYAQRTLIKNFGAVMADAGCAGPSRRRNGSGKTSIGKVGNVRTANGSEAPQIFSDIRPLDGAQFRGVTVLTAGVPCQPASCAGKRRGTTDDRWLWPEALRILRESMPAWAIFENPRGILTLEGGLVFERLLAEMESYGYTVQPIIIPACAVDAKHRRDRVWIVANGNRQGPQRRLGRKLQERSDKWIARTSNPPDADSANGLHEAIGAQCDVWQLENGNGEASGRTCHWLPEPDVGRVAHGIPSRVDRLRCLGNAIVPQVAQIILRAIKQSILTTSKV